jgi:hypothetical protein
VFFSDLDATHACGRAHRVTLCAFARVPRCA